MYDHEIKIERTMLVAWMAEVTPVNPQPHPGKPGASLRMFVLGHDADDENNLILCDETTGGAAWNFCQQHQFVYPNRGSCQMCQGTVAEPALQGSVTPSNSVSGE